MHVVIKRSFLEDADMADDVLEVGDHNFTNEILESRIPALVDFWGPTCGPCKSLEPVIRNLASRYLGRLKVAKVNVDKNPKIAMQYSIKALPTLLLFDGGNVRQQFVGQPTPSALERFLQNSL